MSDKQPINKYIEALNNLVGMDIGYLVYNDDNETFTKKELLLILAEVAKEQYGVEVEE